MADAVEVAIESALLNRYTSLPLSSPDISRAYPNVLFTPPVNGQNACYLQAAFLPVPTLELSVDYGGTNQHSGIFQVSVFYGQNAGELAPGRIVTQIIDWFQRGTVMTKDGFRVEVTKPPRRGPMIKDDPWIMIPVSIPYMVFARNPV